MTSQQTLRAGFATRDITPEAPCFLVGYPHADRIACGTHDPLLASALCLEWGHLRLVIISIDWLLVSSGWVDECRREISRLTAIPCDHVLIAATHTHSGPHTTEVLAWRDDPALPPVDTEYLHRAARLTSEAVMEACGRCEPAEAAWTVADVTGIAGGNRLNSNGPMDPEAGLLRIRSLADQRTLAVMAIYGMHPTILHEDSKLFSADFVAFVRREILQAFPGSGVVYLNGVCGDQSPRPVVSEQTFREAERIGSALGHRMVSALAGCESFRSNFPLDAAVRCVPLQGKTFPSVDKAIDNLQAARGLFEELQRSNADRRKIRTAECSLFGAEELLTLARAETNGEAGKLRENYSMAKVQVFRLGDRMLAAWPGEFFVEFGLEAKRKSSVPLHIATLSNGELQGYIVTPEADVAGGYEAMMSLFPPSVGYQIVDATLELVNGLK